MNIITIDVITDQCSYELKIPERSVLKKVKEIYRSYIKRNDLTKDSFLRVNFSKDE